MARARLRRARAIAGAAATAPAGPDFEAAGPDFEAAGPDFKAAGPDFEAAGPDFEAQGAQGGPRGPFRLIFPARVSLKLHRVIHIRLFQPGMLRTPPYVPL